MTVALPAPAAGYLSWHEAARQLAAGVGPSDTEPTGQTWSAAGSGPLRTLKVILLATYTTDILEELLPVAAIRHRMAFNLRTAPFGQLEQVLLDPGSPVLADRPEYVVLCFAWQDLGLVPGSGPVDEQSAEPSPAERVDVAVTRVASLWRAATTAGARVVQLGLVSPASDPSGATAWTADGSVSSTVRRVNAELRRRAGEQVLFIDAERQAAVVGLARWEDSRFWHAMRQPFALDAAPYLAALVAGTIAHDVGLTRRCVVLDLDGTLWDGVLGEDGIDGIEPAGGPRGEAFLAFQQFLRGLRERGIVLAVASKNDRDLALRALAEHPGMLLRPQDFAAIVADWRPKSAQLRDIADQLRLGPGSLVFVDDNPAERAEVAASLPAVEVVDLPAQPSGFPAALEAAPGLFAGPLLAEDTTRAESYTALAAGAELAAADSNIEDYLRRLSMTAEIAPVSEVTLPRAAQLIVKTNQFNLTGRRRTQTELAAQVADDSWRCWTMRMRDAFADHGIVGVVVAQTHDRVVEIDTLVLSCRVIGRTAEQNLVAAVSRWARVKGCSQLVGLRRATDRNGVTANIYPGMGFATDLSTPGRFLWDLAGGPVAPSRFIHEEQHE
ncbi:MAG: hypothetical protein JWN03_7021 [Nocardia sp.]|uniref:HAD-IIIC family phosphatase n=1 Tax=Nocardia sp. TaxID=1821 RepID=UPI002605B725|nr:HAD-IIIC family phosphatase [Nocardia sp.]MCU1646746.1 hypothetical protein [Nocardia sp.]